MALATDFLRLSDQQFFKQLSKVILESSPKVKNILDCRDNILYLWNTAENCLYALNLKTWPENNTNVIYQTLLPSDAASFSVERISTNKSATQLLAFGPNGVTVMNLPPRWGKFSMFQGGKAVMQCKSRELDKRYFSCNSHIVINQARWHPDLTNDSHVFVLTSDNSFRVYDTSGNDPILLNVWTFGRRPASTRVPILAGLGDISVDFDFTPPVNRENLLPYMKKNTNLSLFDTITYPILVLYGNGDVYTVIFSLTNKTVKPLVHGPLPMVPPDDDNYGVDACSILCLGSSPPTVVISTCAGTLYHCLLINSEDEDDNQLDLSAWPSVANKFGISSPVAFLYVVECIELELGLSFDDNEDLYTCPVLLQNDYTTHGRYFCFHDTGLHIVCVPFISELEELLNTKSNMIDVKIPSLKEKSCAEYAVCTRTSGNATVQPVQGLAVSTSPTAVICLLANGEIVTLALASLNIMIPSMSLDEKELPSTSMQREMFGEHIKRLLHREMSQPVMKLSHDSTPTPRESMDLLSHATTILREEYILRHTRVKGEIERKVTALRKINDYQLQELETLQQKRIQLKATAEHLAEKYEDVKDKQEELTRRAEHILRLATNEQPCTTSAQKKFLASLNERKKRVSEVQEGINSTREKMAHHFKEIELSTKEQKEHETHLNDSQQKVLKSNLAQLSQGVHDLVKGMEKVMKLMECDIPLLSHNMENLDL